MADNATLSTWETFYGNYRDPRSLTAFYFVLVASSGLVIVLVVLFLRAPHPGLPVLIEPRPHRCRH